jgi:hypothetical protein
MNVGDSVVDGHRFDAEADPTFHFDADPDSDLESDPNTSWKIRFFLTFMHRNFIFILNEIEIDTDPAK